MTEKDKALGSKYKGKIKSNRLKTNYLLIIGVDKYSNGITPLDNAVKDAKSFQDLLLKNYQFEKRRLTTLFNEEATRSNIIKTFRDLLNGLTDDDNLVFYYSGHGEVLQSGRRKRGYWIPYDAVLHNAATYLSNNAITELFQDSYAHHIFGIVDSCFSGSLFKTKSLSSVEERLESAPSRWLLTAGRMEVVSDGSLGENSPFASSLLTHLKTNTEDVLWTSELCNRVLKSVSYNTDKQMPRGEPLQNVGHMGGQFVFYKKGYKPKAPLKKDKVRMSESAEELGPDDLPANTIDVGSEPANEEISDLGKGNLLYDIPKRMQLEQVAACKVRIAKDKDILIKDLQATSNAVFRDVPKITQVMNVDLVDVSGGKHFTIVEGSSEEQYIESNSYTEWTFFVTPLKAGKHQLLLKVSTIQVLNNKERKKDLTFLESIDIIAEKGGGGATQTLAEFKNRLKELLGKEEIEKAISEFKQHLSPDSSKANDLILLQSRYNSTRNSQNRDVITFEQASRAFNQIKYALIDYIDDLEEADVVLKN